ncbi:hypothetical protein [Bacillus mycoides]|uniref:hypothetical protein n=1 Tax=Bacillus mycoides TaxID=1405 RepID=UPI00086451AF|nr:hypothetical protein [Bacillus mycoides]OHX31076.1 hypothetical protein BWGOE5_29810 [Bacillus mycoides]SCM90505.1 Uncharacterized protein BWAI21_06026 [Bacillus mycoides]
MNIIIYDVRNVIKKNINKWVLWCVFLFVLCVLSVITLNGSNETNNCLDLWFLLFGGVKDYTPGTMQFPPFSWLLIQASLAFLVGDYLYNELKENSFYVLVRVKRRFNWFFAKIVWIIITVVLFYMTILLSLVLSSLYLDLDINMWGSYSRTIFENQEILFINPLTFFSLSFFICFITSLVLSLVQVMLTLIIKPIYSYIFIIFILLLSVYISSPILLGRYLMVIRYIDYFSNGIFEGMHIIVYEILVFFFVLILGSIYFRKMNLV